ncbi:MAG: dTDP-4-dehydrorhamnose reductase [Candidatus Saccharibacteria bacterium]
MRIVILGAQGNLGQQLVTVFKSNTLNEVIGWDKGEIDITDQGLVKKKIADLKPNVIINAVAYNAVDQMESDEGFELAKKLNATAVGYIAQAALDNNAVIVHYSTDYVFAGDKTEGYTESDQPSPISRYGESKLMGEQEIIRLSGRGLKWYLIRTSKLFGPKGESEVAKPSFFDVMRKLGEEKKELEIVDEEMSCFTYTPDLAAQTKEIVEGDYGYGIYHVVNSKPATWFQAAQFMFRQIGNKIKLIPVSSEKFPRPAKRPKYSVLVSTKLKKMRSYQDALKEYLSIK